MENRTERLRDAIPPAPAVPAGGAGNGTTVTVRPPDQARDLLQVMEQEFEKALPDILPLDLFMRVTLTGLRTTPKLLECHRPSLYGVLLECARLGLQPCTEQATIIPVNGRDKRLEAKLIIGYEGYITLMYRTGRIDQLYVEVVYERDEWEFVIGDGGRFVHRPRIDLPADQRGKPLFAYGFATLVGGGRTRITVVSYEEALRLQAEYGTHRDSPWRKHFHQMFLKTVVRRMQRWAPKSSESSLLRRAVEVDGTVVGLDGAIKAAPEGETPAGETPAGETPAGETPEPVTGAGGWEDATIVAPGSAGGTDGN